MVAMTLSPAPVTSKTSRAAVAMWRGRLSRSNRLMPCSPRVMSAASQPSMLENPRARGQEAGGIAAGDARGLLGLALVGSHDRHALVAREVTQLGVDQDPDLRRRARASTLRSKRSVTTPFW